MSSVIPSWENQVPTPAAASLLELISLFFYLHCNAIFVYVCAFGEWEAFEKQAAVNIPMQPMRVCMCVCQ